jgi:hypothetical protein
MAVNIEDVISEWKIDNTINETKLALEITRTPMLHSKYLDYYVYYKSKLAVTESKYNKLKWIKRKYFRGEFELKDLEKYGWSQWQGLKPTNAELNDLFEMDNDLNDLQEKISYFKTGVSTTEYILKAVSGREWTLKALFEYMKYTSGV